MGLFSTDGTFESLKSNVPLPAGFLAHVLTSGQQQEGTRQERVLISENDLLTSVEIRKCHFVDEDVKSCGLQREFSPFLDVNLKNVKICKLD